MVFQKLLGSREKALKALGSLDWLPPLAARVSAGVLFAQAGWGKLNNIEKVIGFFAELGIPAPEIQARVVGALELGCGSLIFLGLMTRLASMPLAVIMAVAVATAKSDEISGVSDLFGIYEYLYIVIFLYLIFQGAGALSLDALLLRRREQGAGARESGGRSGKA